jgi:hypothetical protein
MMDLEPLTSQTTVFLQIVSFLITSNYIVIYLLFTKMSPLQDSPELPPTRASVRRKATSRKQEKILDKTVDASPPIDEPADNGQAQTEETKKKNMV